MVPLTESISNRYPELTMITGGAETASRDTLTLVFWAASAGVALHFRIATPLRGKHEVVAVEATPERNRLRENPLESGTVCPFPICKLSILLVNASRCQERLRTTVYGSKPAPMAQFSASGIEHRTNSTLRFSRYHNFGLSKISNGCFQRHPLWKR